MKPQAEYRQIKFTDNDVVNSNDYIPAGEHNPHNVRPYLVYDQGFTLAVVFADSAKDALNKAANDGKLDSYIVFESDLVNYNRNEEGISMLGDASEPFDIQALDVVELPNPPFSFVALFNNNPDFYVK